LAAPAWQGIFPLLDGGCWGGWAQLSSFPLSGGKGVICFSPPFPAFGSGVACHAWVVQLAGLALKLHLGSESVLVALAMTLTVPPRKVGLWALSQLCPGLLSLSSPSGFATPCLHTRSSFSPSNRGLPREAAVRWGGRKGGCNQALVAPLGWGRTVAGGRGGCVSKSITRVVWHTHFPGNGYSLPDRLMLPGNC
jgi:hypothetical protein